MSNFNKTTIDFGDLKGDEVLPFEFELINKPFPIKYCYTGCACTKLKEFPVDKVKGELHVKNTGFAARNNQVHRVITVVFDDGLEEHVPDGVGKAIKNKKKLTEVLTLIGNVIPESNKVKD